MSHSYAAQNRSDRSLPLLWRGNRRPPARSESARAAYLQFLFAFLRNPITVGALLPSSPHLARSLLSNIDLRTARTVVELGPGTGAITQLILERLGKETCFFAIELDGPSVQTLRRRLGAVEVYHDSAENLPGYLDRRGLPHADCIICGLPWANMTPALQDRILDAIVRSLSPTGVFNAFGYVLLNWLPTPLRFRRRLYEQFETVKISPVVWRNVPPAFVYRCRRVKPHARAETTPSPAH